jgi:hypothetical protein
MTVKTPMSGSPEKRRDCMAQLPLRSTSGGSKYASEHVGEEIQLDIAHRLFIDIIGSSERFSASTLSRNSLHFTSNSPRKMAQSQAADQASVPRACVARPPFWFVAEVFLLSRNFISASDA